MEITLSPALAEIVRRFMATGQYATAEAVVAEALMTLETTTTMQWGEVNADLTFVPLSETEMLQGSEVAIANYEATGNAVRHPEVRAWIENLDIDGPPSSV